MSELNRVSSSTEAVKIVFIHHGTSISRVAIPATIDGEEYHDYGVDIETGEIWSLKGRARSGKAVKMKSRKRTRGDLDITLCKDGVKKSFLVHRIVASTLIPKIAPKGIEVSVWNKIQNSDFYKDIKNLISLEVNHIDARPDNNRPENLEWSTTQHNKKQYYKSFGEEHMQRSRDGIAKAAAKKMEEELTGELLEC
jgi:hypothetical protein